MAMRLVPLGHGGKARYCGVFVGRWRCSVWDKQHTLRYVFKVRLGGQPNVDFRVEALHPINIVADIPYP